MAMASPLVRYNRLVNIFLVLVLVVASYKFQSGLRGVECSGAIRSDADVLAYQALVTPCLYTFFCTLTFCLVVFAFTLSSHIVRAPVLCLAILTTVMGTLPLVNLDKNGARNREYVQLVMDRYSSTAARIQHELSLDPSRNLTHSMRLMDYHLRQGLGQQMPYYLVSDALYAEHHQQELACLQGDAGSCTRVKMEDARIDPRRPIMTHLDALFGLYRI